MWSDDDVPQRVLAVVGPWRCGMWKAMGDLLTRAREVLGIEIPEIPDLTAATDAVTAAVDTASGQAEELTTTMAGAATDLASGVTDAATTAGEAATGMADQVKGAAASLPEQTRG